MKIALKKLEQQVIVITGASSGIGLCTARLAAKAGARLVLAARSEEALRRLCDEINQAGGRAVHVVADVSRQDDVRRIAEAATAHFGGFDTWINNAGVSIYASKHAVKGFTDGLRMELAMDGAPVSVTLIQPSSIDTPYTVHAKNYMDREAKHGPPAYAPETVARAIVHCCATPERSGVVGGGGRAFIGMENWTPALLDKFMETSFAQQEHAGYPPRPLAQNGLDHAAGQLKERGNYPGHTRETSFYTEAVTAGNPALRTALLVGAGLGLAAWLGRAKKSTPANGANGHPAPADRPAPAYAEPLDGDEMDDVLEGGSL